MNEFVRIHDGLLHFFNNAKINIVHNDKFINLMDFFPVLKTGICRKTTLTPLMISYSKINNLYIDHRKIKANESMMKSFGSDIPSYKSIGGCLTSDAIENDLFMKRFNTFDLLKSDNNNFNHESFDYINFQKICSLNYNDNDHELVEFLFENRNHVDKIVYETNLTKEIHTLTAYSLNRNLMGVLRTAIKLELYNLIYELTQDKYVELLFDILTDNCEEVKTSLIYVDPRSYHYEAYNLALEMNKNCTQLIKENIILRYWLEKQVFNINIKSILGDESDLSNNLLSNLYCF